MVSRRMAARYGAPLAFLAAVTIAVLLVRAGMDEATRRNELPGGPATPTATQRAKPTATFYVVRAGDTIGAIAPRFGLTAAELVTLNPGIEPTALRVGQRIRVR
jgi:LysM repeat protein